MFTQNYRIWSLKHRYFILCYLSAAASYAQILYTDIVPDQVSEEISIDLNLDGTIDFTIFSSNLFGDFIYVQGDTNIEILSEYNCGYNFALALNEGEAIGTDETIWVNPLPPRNVLLLSYPAVDGCNNNETAYGNWQNATDLYLGLKLIQDGEIHYGWARLNTLDGYPVKLKDFAYNETPNEAINAGETTLSVEDYNYKAITIRSMENEILVSNITIPFQYTLWSITGERLLSGSVSKNANRIRHESLSTGIYIIELTNLSDKVFFRKKLLMMSDK